VALLRRRRRPTVITPRQRHGALRLAWHGLVDVIRYRRLIGQLARVEMRRKGSDTALGNLWWVLDPLLQVAVYGLIFTLVFSRAAPDFALFLFSALLPWKWLSASLNDAARSVVAHEGLIRQVAFPRIVLPLAAVLAGVANFCFSLVALLALLALLPGHLSAQLLWLPVLAGVQLLLTIALALPIAALNVFYRDIGVLLRHVLLFVFFLSPALWSFSLHARLADGSPMAQSFFELLRLNPLAVLLESYRGVIYGEALPGGEMLPPQAPDVGGLGALVAASIVALVAGVVLFKRLERDFVRAI
jgi:lipopolysaccharide transport system permease protein